MRGRGYDGGYDAVRRYARRWAQERGQATAAAFVPLSFAPGEAYQFDWSHEIVLLSGATVTVKVAHVRLCHSRMLFVRAYPRVETGNDSWRFKSRGDHQTTRARAVSATLTSSDGASATAKTRRSKGSLLGADQGAHSNAD